MLIGLVAGAVIGAAVGAALLTGAAPEVPGPTPEIMHAAPALVDPDRNVDLSAAVTCETSDSASCRVASATAYVRPAGAGGWTGVEGRLVDGAYRFRIASELVPHDGFSYWLEFRSDEGSATDYPPGGQASAFRVLTTAGLPEVALGSFSWDDVQAPLETLVRMPYGSEEGRAGLSGGDGDTELLGPSSFAVGPGGWIYVADWVNRRIEVFSPRGSFRRTLAAPVRRPVDLAVGPDGGIALSTMGTGAQAFELDPEGRVLGRYPIGYGIAARVVTDRNGPDVMVGPSQWVPARGTLGSPLGVEAQAEQQVPAVASAAGTFGLSDEEPGNRVTAVWTRPDGSRAGVILRLPRGVRAGTDFFVRPLPDGGAVVARGLWDDTHFAVGLILLGATGDVRSFAILPEPSTEQAARFSTVRFRAPLDVLVAYSDDHALRIDRFEVTS
jgi:hypothetical protein